MLNDTRSMRILPLADLLSNPPIMMGGPNNMGGCTSSTVTQFIVPCAMDVFSAFGKILFCFGGMAVFPSIQVDMKNPKRFTKVVMISISTIVAMMIPVATLGYYYHAGAVKPNILEQVDESAILSLLANLLITSHLLFAFVIIQNPIAQRVEIPFNIDQFGIKRVGVRTMVSVTSKY